MKGGVRLDRTIRDRADGAAASEDRARHAWPDVEMVAPTAPGQRDEDLCINAFGCDQRLAFRKGL